MPPSEDPTVLAGVRRRRVSGLFWRQGPTGHSLLSFADPAVTDGRYHRVGGPGVWYASDQEQAAWAELFRHFTQDGVDPFEVRRRTGNLTVVDLDVVDLTVPAVRRHLNLEVTDLNGVSTPPPNASPLRPRLPVSEGSWPPQLHSPTARPSSCSPPGSPT